MTASSQVSVVIFTSDLMVASRLGATGEQSGICSQQVTSLAACCEAIRLHQPAWLVIDLETCQVEAADVAQLRGEHAGMLRVIAFGPHVLEQKLELARQAGCDLVWTRGQIHRDFATLVGGQGA